MCAIIVLAILANDESNYNPLLAASMPRAAPSNRWNQSHMQPVGELLNKSGYSVASGGFLVGRFSRHWKKEKEGKLRISVDGRRRAD